MDSGPVLDMRGQEPEGRHRHRDGTLNLQESIVSKMIIRKNNPRVIINADDFGITQGVNKAIFELVDAGIVTSTSVMTNMPDYGDVAVLRDKIGIGVHFNLTVGRPIVETQNVPTLVNSKGNFYDLSQLLTKMKKRRFVREEVEIEFEAQVKQLINIGIEPDHINSHESLLKYPFFMGIIKKIAKKYKIMGVRTYSPRKFDYKRLLNPRKIAISFYLKFQKLGWKRNGFSVTDKYDSLIQLGLNQEIAFKKLRDIFRNLPCGVLEIGVHPGYCNGNNISMGNYVYEREVELQTLLSDRFKKIIFVSGAELICFKDI
ncbi:MAG: ChbG/HpnK family deacetylase [Nitrospirae bacterium]|nr:ChbG/HpnK family deacetylase [Nitrospirota bacterium]